MNDDFGHLPAIHPQFLKTNLERACRWHKGGIEEWSLNDWLCAAGGELGEAMNAAKKLRRVEDDLANFSADEKRHIASVGGGKAQVLEELVDTFCYVTLAMMRLGADPATINRAIADKFNQVSSRYSFPERI